MGLSDFKLNNNGKNEQLQNAKNGVRKEQVDKKFHNLFDAYDTNKDGTLETSELNEINKNLNTFAGVDKILDNEENDILVTSLFTSKMDIQNTDFMGFLKSVSAASADIIESKETPTSDGGKEVTTIYKDGLTETISYYPNGEYKFKKIDQNATVTRSLDSYTIGNNMNTKYTAKQLESKIKKAYNELAAKNAEINTIEGKNLSIIPDYADFKQAYFKKYRIKQGTESKNIDRHEFELSERAKRDKAVRDSVINHYVETHQAVKEVLDSMGLLDDAGALINAGAGEVWNLIKNKWNGTNEEYQNFFELKEKFKPSYEKSLQMQKEQKIAQQHQEDYFRGEIGDIDIEKSIQFQKKVEQYQNAQVLKQKLNLLKTAMNEVEQFSFDQSLTLHSAGTSEGINSASHIVKANKLLLEYFGGDQNAVDMILDGATGDKNSKVVQAIKDIYNETQKMNEIVLDGKTFEEVQQEYKSQYKEIYNTDFIAEELTEKTMEAKATGGMVKLAAITIISYLITKSSIISEINAAVAGGVETGSAIANATSKLVPILMRQGLAKEQAVNLVQQSIRFAMTSSTVAEDATLTLFNQLTSERGYNEEEFTASTKSAAKYIYFGAYIGSPVANAVGNAVSEFGLARGLMRGGNISTKGALKTTTLNGEKVFENILKTGKSVGQKLAVNSAKFGTDVGMFSALGVATDGQEVSEAFAEQSTFLPKLKIMNHVLEYALGRMMGGKAGKITPITERPIDDKMNAAIEQSGIKDWEIKEIKSPSKSIYEVTIDKDLPPIRFKSSEELITVIMETVAKTYNNSNATLNSQKNDNKKETNLPKGLTTEDDAIINKAKSENPADVVADKIKEQWQQTDVNKNTPTENIDLSNLDTKAGLNQAAPKIKDEVTSLIFTGKLKDTLTKHYNELGNVFKEIAQKRSNDIKTLAEKCGDNKETFAKGIVDILSEEMGMKGFEPEIIMTETGKNNGAADWTKGAILIDENISNVEKLVEIISHEYIHMLQYRDILAQYGEQGLKEVVMNDKSISSKDKKTKLSEILQSPYTKKLLENYNALKHSPENSLNEYLTRIYKEEFANPINPDKDLNKYANQTTESEAYNQSYALSQNTTGLKDIELTKGWDVQVIKAFKANNDNEFVLNSDGSITWLENIPKNVSNKNENNTQQALNGIKIYQKAKEAITTLTENLKTENLSDAKQNELKNIINELKTTVENVEKQLDSNISEEEAIKILEPLWDKNSSYELKNIINYTCKLSDGNISKILVEKTAFLIKNNISYYRVDRFKNNKTNKVDFAKVLMFDKLIEQKTKPDDALNLISDCNGKDGYFDETIYEKRMALNKPFAQSANSIIQSCKVDDKVDEKIFQKAKELESFGFDYISISNLIDICRKTNILEAGEFSQEIYDKIIDLKDNHKIELKEIDDILKSCLNDETKEIDSATYQLATTLKNHVDDCDINTTTYNLKNVKNPLEAIKYLDELQQKYGVPSSRAIYVLTSAMDNKGDDFSASYVFNPQKYEKTKELLSEHKMSVMDTRKLLKICNINGEFNQNLYDKAINLRTTLGQVFSDRDINSLLTDCIYTTKDKNGNNVQAVNNELIDKIKVWYDIDTQNLNKTKSEQNTNQVDYFNEYDNLLNNLSSSPSDVIAYVEKFKHAGFDTKTIIESFHFYDENNNTIYDKSLLDKVFELNKSYNIDNEELRRITMSNDVNTTKTNLDNVKRLLDAGWNPKEITRMQHLFDYKNRTLQPTEIEFYEKYLKEGVTNLSIYNTMNYCRKDNTLFSGVANLDNAKFENLINIIKKMPKEKQDSVQQLLNSGFKHSDNITECLNAGADVESLQALLNNYNFKASQFENRQGVILELIKEHPDRIQDIISIIDHNTSFSDKEAFEFCLSRFENNDWQNCLDACNNYARSGGYYSRDKFNSKFNNIFDIMKKLNSPEISNENLINFSNILAFKNNAEGVAPEVITKIKELAKDGSLQDVLNNSLYLLATSNPEYAKVLEAFNQAEKSGMDKDLLKYVFKKIHSGENNEDKIYSDYKAVLDFFTKNSDLCTQYLKESAVSKDKLSDNAKLGKFLMEYEPRQYSYSETKPQSSEFGINTLEKLLNFAKQGINIINMPEFNKQNNAEQIAGMLEKVDIQKYSREINFILSGIDNSYKIQNYDKLFDEKMTKENLDFILDAQKVILDNETSLGHVQRLDNSFFKIFTECEISEEALNKMRFYIESEVSRPDRNGAVGFDQYRLYNVARLYTQCPDKIEYFENIIFNENDDKIMYNLSSDKAVLNKQFELLELMEQNPDSKFCSSEKGHVFRTDDNIKDLDAKLEFWKFLNDKKESVNTKLKTRTPKNYFRSSCSVMEYIKENNKNVAINAVNKGYSTNEVRNLASCSTEINSNLINNLIDKNYSNSFVQAIANNTFNSSDKVKFVNRLLDEKSYTETDIKNIIHNFLPNNAETTELLCFDKELNFPHEYIANIIYYINDANKPVAHKLCTDKELDFPKDKISFTISQYRENMNPNTYVNQMKLFIKCGFTEDIIVSILRNAENLNKFTDNVCKVLEHLTQKGINIGRCVNVLTSDEIPMDLPLQIETLEMLSSIDNSDIKILSKEGIDIYNKIKKLQELVNIKQPTIETTKEGRKNFLKGFANNNNAENIIKNLDLSPFEKTGIPLQYSRQEFMDNMQKLIISGKTDKTDINISDIQIPNLKLSDEAQKAVKDKIEEFKDNPNFKQNKVTYVINGKTCDGIEFTGSHTNGSNPGEFTLIDGNLYYVKKPSANKLEQSVEEVIASQLYRLAGIDSPNEHCVYDTKGKIIGMASEYIPNMKDVSNTKTMYDSFAVDAWLANWDAPKNDNTQEYDGGKVIKSDVGGSLHYRARGDLKSTTGYIFNGTVNELNSLIKNNAVYNNMTREDLLNSLQHVIDIPTEAIYKVIKESPSFDSKLADTLAKRKEFITIFAEKLKSVNENLFSDIESMISEAMRLTNAEFKESPDIAEAFGYLPNTKGFEGLLNTKYPDNLNLTQEEQQIANQMKTEIEQFSVKNKLSDKVNVSQETADFINGILQGIPEFASYFGKPQHGNGNVDENGKQISGQQYPLDIHILKVLQKSLNNPIYNSVDEFGNKLLSDESKIVLKFSTLLHDIGKRYLGNNQDAGHAELSAKYVYSILDRFNLPARVKNRIINIVNNHHWFAAYCKKEINAEAVATMFRSSEDFAVARIMAQADLESVREGFLEKTMQLDFPTSVHDKKSAYEKFNKIMDDIQQKVNSLENTAPIITPSKFVETPQRINSNGKIIPRRGFPNVEIELDGKKETFYVLNLHDISDDTDMYQYGFNHIKKKDLRLLVHRPGDGNMSKLTSFKILGDNPIAQSLQSLSLISPDNTAAYCGQKFACVIESNNNNIGVAYPSNAGTGSRKTQINLLEEIFGSDKARENSNQNGRLGGFNENDKRRLFFKEHFIEYMLQKGIFIDDKTYRGIIRYVRNKQYIETQLKDLKIGSTILKKDVLSEALKYSSDKLIEITEQKTHGSHDEITEIDCHVVAGGATAPNIDNLMSDEYGKEFLRTCRDHCNRRIILW